MHAASLVSAYGGRPAGETGASPRTTTRTRQHRCGVSLMTADSHGFLRHSCPWLRSRFNFSASICSTLSRWLSKVFVNAERIKSYRRSGILSSTTPRKAPCALPCSSAKTTKPHPHGANDLIGPTAAVALDIIREGAGEMRPLSVWPI